MGGEHGTEEEETGRQLLDGKGLRPGTVGESGEKWTVGRNGPPPFS